MKINIKTLSQKHIKAFFSEKHKGNQTKLIFLSCPHILSKHVLPDMQLAFKASRPYTVLYGVLGMAPLFRVVLRI